MPALLLLLALAATSATATKATADANDPVRVMTFNLRYGLADDGADSWEHRKDLLLATITTFAPDILGTQECLAMQRDAVADALPNYHVIAAGRDDGQDGGEMCAVFVRAARFDVIDSGHFWLSPTPDVVASKGWDAALCRMATWARLADREHEDRRLLVVNTHWDHVGVEARCQSARLVRQKAIDLAQGIPIILTGDFNTEIPATEEDAAGRILREGDGDGLPRLTETYATITPRGDAPTGTFHAFTGTPTTGRIDAILVSPNVAVLQAAIVDTSRDGHWPSDHYPVTATLKMP